MSDESVSACQTIFGFAIARDDEVAKHAIHLQLASSQITTHRSLSFFSYRPGTLLATQPVLVSLLIGV